MKVLLAIDQGLSASSKVDIELRKEILVSQESEWNRMCAYPLSYRLHKSDQMV